MFDVGFGLVIVLFVVELIVVGYFEIVVYLIVDFLVEFVEGEYVVVDFGGWCLY